MPAPSRPDEIPDFLLERFDEYDPRTLRAIGTYAQKQAYTAPEEVPSSTVQSLALQDDATLAAIGEYVEAVADFLEERDAESLATVSEDEGEPNEESWGHRQIRNWHGF
ncbi:hypothetical protein ACFQGT_13880 [Natrialbaceae archaeon GCM10025810]|uniref:hypothetical protein n=1 Tax=Halovalidus salilacus TaxID=3075124 RepID=UPI0036144349